MTETPARTTDVLLTLTDEEVAVLGGAEGIAILPIWSQLTEAERKTAGRAGFRGLIARGLVEMPTDEALAEHEHAGPGADLRVQMQEGLQSVMTLRQSATAVVAVARTAAGGQDFLYAHCVADVTLLEEVGNQGLHNFALGTTAGLEDFLLGTVLHPDAADGEGEPIEVSAGEAPPELIAALGDAHLRSDVIFRQLDDPSMPLLGFFSGPKGTWLVRADYRSDQFLHAEPITVAEARAALAELARRAAAVAAAHAPDAGEAS